jgi:hypothetical protein
MNVKVVIDDIDLKSVESDVKRLRAILEEANDIIMRLRRCPYLYIKTEISADDAGTSPTE